MDIFQKLVQIRKEKKRGQKELAYHLGITTTTINRYERGKRKIPYDLMCKYAEFLEMDIRILIK